MWCRDMIIFPTWIWTRDLLQTELHVSKHRTTFKGGPWFNSRSKKFIFHFSTTTRERSIIIIIMFSVGYFTSRSSRKQNDTFMFALIWMHLEHHTTIRYHITKIVVTFYISFHLIFPFGTLLSWFIVSNGNLAMLTRLLMIVALSQYIVWRCVWWAAGQDYCLCIGTQVIILWRIQEKWRHT